MALATGFFLALILSLALMPLAIRVAWATGYLDQPEARKLHTSATAILGGAAVFVCSTLAWVVAHVFMPPVVGIDELLVVTGAGVATLIGMWDDKYGMRPSVKLIGQAVASGFLLATGVAPDLGMTPFLNLFTTWIALIALMNAINFLDNMNGVIGGLSAITLAAFAMHSVGRGAIVLASWQLAMAGACAGFLPFNFPRGRIFLGDAGSLLLGYSLGTSALLAFDAAPADWGRVGVFLMLAYPTFDLLFVVVNRIREGRKVYEGGKDHSNHRLARLIPWTTTVLLIWLSGAALCASGLEVLRRHHPMPALILSALWLGIFLLAAARLSSVPVAQPSPRPLAATRTSPSSSSGTS